MGEDISLIDAMIKRALTPILALEWISQAATVLNSTALRSHQQANESPRTLCGQADGPLPYTGLFT